MGGNFAQDLALSTIPLDQQIAMHLRSNHYPPVPLTMVQPCLHAIVEGHHLNAWLYQEQEIE